MYRLKEYSFGSALIRIGLSNSSGYIGILEKPDMNDSIASDSTSFRFVKSRCKLFQLFRVGFAKNLQHNPHHIINT
jgi:hypothetical protein